MTTRLLTTVLAATLAAAPAFGQSREVALALAAVDRAAAAIDVAQSQSERAREAEERGREQEQREKERADRQRDRESDAFDSARDYAATGNGADTADLEYLLHQHAALLDFAFFRLEHAF